MPLRLDNLTALRFFAAFSVFLHHLRPFDLNLSKSLWGVNLGWTVSFFFVLSGFVLSYSYHGRIRTLGDSGRFIAVRFFRLWPLHVACGLIALALIGASSAPNLTKVYLFLTLQHAWIPSLETAFFLNAVSWSISVELFFYIVFGLISVLSIRTGILLIAAWTFAVVVLMLFVSWNPAAIPFGSGAPGSLPSMVTEQSFFHLFPPVRIVEFFAGILTFHLYARIRMPRNLIFPAQLACVVLIIAYMPLHRPIIEFLQAEGPRVFAQVYPRSGMFLLFALVVYVFAHQHGAVSRILSCRPLVFLGEISFAIYMVHQILIVFLQSHGAAVVFGPWPAAFCAFALTVIASWTLYRFVERPGLAWAKTTFAAPRRSTVVP